MALIVCNNCGKKISDTTSECIHCGAKVGAGFNCDASEVETVEKVDKAEKAGKSEAQTKAKEKHSKIKYRSLSEEKKEKLECDFMEIDKVAGSWRKKAISNEYFLKISKVFLFISAVVFFALRLFSNVLPVEIFDKTNERAGVCLAIGLIGFCVVGATSFIVMGICEIMRSLRYGKKKKVIYFKRFEAWLLENDIIFDKSILSDKEKKLYEKIDHRVDKI